MNSAIRQIVEQLLAELRRDLDEVPETGEFPDRRRELALPPPYGPTRRLVLTLTDANEYAMLRHIEARVEDEVGYSSQDQFLGTSAELREMLGSEEAPAKIERFLERIVEHVDKRIEAVQPLTVPLVGINRGGVLYAALDPRRTEFEQWGPGDLHISKWHLLQRASGGWRDAGVAQEQAESERYYLHSRVLETIGSFHGRTVDEFSFYVWEGPLPPLPQKGAADDGQIDQEDPVIARLRDICRDIINESTNFEQALVEQVKRAGRRDTDEGEPAHLRLRSTSLAGGRIGLALLGACFGLLLLWVAMLPIKEAWQGDPDWASIFIFAGGGLLFVGGFLALLPSTVLWIDIGQTIKIRQLFRVLNYKLDDVKHIAALAQKIHAQDLAGAKAIANLLDYRHLFVGLLMTDDTFYQVSTNARSVSALQNKLRALGRPDLAQALAREQAID